MSGLMCSTWSNPRIVFVDKTTTGQRTKKGKRKHRKPRHTAKEMPTTESNGAWSEVLRHDGKGSPCVEFRESSTSRVVLRVKYAQLPRRTVRQVTAVMVKAMDNMHAVRAHDNDTGSMVSFGKRVLHGCVKPNYAVKDKADSDAKSKALREQDMAGAVDTAGRLTESLFITWPEYGSVAKHRACSKGGRPGTFSGSCDLTNGDHYDPKVRNIQPACCEICIAPR